MKTATAPEKTIAESRNDRFSAGLIRQTTYQPKGKGRESTYKFLAKLAADQSSAKREKTMRTGMDRRLL